MVIMEYSKLLADVNRRVRYVSDEVLDDIKEHFREEIDSNRTFERINSMASLIAVLERRDCLSHENVEPLRYIIGKLDGVADDLIVCNGRVSNGGLLNNLHIYPEHHVLPDIPDNATDEVFYLISSEIGRKWKDLARNLKVSEGSIDELDQLQCGIREKVLQVLRFHKKKSDTKYWKYWLLTALLQTRRADLAEKVKDVFGKHGL